MARGHRAGMEGRRGKQRWAAWGHPRGSGSDPARRGLQAPAHIEDADVVVDEIFHHLDLVLPFAVGLEEAGCEEQRQVLGAHLVEVCAFLHPGTSSTEVSGWSRSGWGFSPGRPPLPRTNSPEKQPGGPQPLSTGNFKPGSSCFENFPLPSNQTAALPQTPTQGWELSVFHLFGALRDIYILQGGVP